MSQSNVSHRVANPEKPSGTVSTFMAPVKLLASILKWLLLALLFSIIVEVIGQTFFWSDQGAAHSLEVLRHDLAYLAKPLKESVGFIEPQKEITSYFLIVESKIRGVGFYDYVDRFNGGLYNYTYGILWTIETFMLRVLILVFSLPMFTIIAFVGLVDGIICRVIRRWSGGRESSWFFHRAASTVPILFILPWVVYLGLPFSIHPNLVILPSAVITAISIHFSAKSFKKYL